MAFRIPKDTGIGVIGYNGDGIGVGSSIASAFPKAKGAKIMPNDNVCIVFPGGVARKMPQRLNDASLSDRSPINQHCCLKCHAIQSVKTDTCDMG